STHFSSAWIAPDTGCFRYRAITLLLTELERQITLLERCSLLNIATPANRELLMCSLPSGWLHAKSSSCNTLSSAAVAGRSLLDYGQLPCSLPCRAYLSSSCEAVMFKSPAVSSSTSLLASR